MSGPALRPPLAAYAALAASMAIVGSYVGLSRWLIAVFPVFLLAWLRFAVAAIAMLGWLRPARGEPRLGSAERRLLFLESLLGNFLFSVCMLYGVALSSAVAAGVVMAAIPAAVALLSRAVLGERLERRVAAALACAAAGIALLAAPRGASAATGSNPALGHLLLLAAVLCEASYVVIGKRLTGKVTPKRISALINLWGLALVTPFGLWAARSFDFSAVPAGAWALLVFYSIAASIVTVWLWMTGLRHVPAASAGVFAVLMPLGAAAVGVLLLGEPFRVEHAAAFALALAGLLLATWPRRGTAVAVLPP